MKQIDDMITALRTLRDTLPEKTVEITMQYGPEIEDMQTAQFEAGIDRDGDRIGPDYSPFTVAIKQEKGQPTDRVTLRDEGDFYAGVKVFKGKSAFSIGSTDEKTGKLEEKYGSEIFGLTDEHLQEVIDLVRPDLLEYARQTLTQ